MKKRTAQKSLPSCHQWNRHHCRSRLDRTTESGKARALCMVAPSSISQPNFCKSNPILVLQGSACVSRSTGKSFVTDDSMKKVFFFSQPLYSLVAIMARAHDFKDMHMFLESRSYPCFVSAKIIYLLEMKARRLLSQVASC